MAASLRERLTNRVGEKRTRGEYFHVRTARSLPRFLTDTPIIEAKPRRVNKSKKKHDQKEKRQQRQEKKKIQRQTTRSTQTPV